jgi:hypothetical protein
MLHKMSQLKEYIYKSDKINWSGGMLYIQVNGPNVQSAFFLVLEKCSLPLLPPEL